MPFTLKNEGRSPALVFTDGMVDARDRDTLNEYVIEFGAAHILRCDSRQGANRVYTLISARSEAQCVIKFPQYDVDPDASTLAVAAREAHALRFLAKQPQQPIRIPSLIRHDAHTGIRIIEGLPGWPMRRADFLTLASHTAARSTRLARSIGQYIGWLSTRDPERYATAVKDVGCTPYFDWDTSIRSTIGSFEDPVHHPVVTRLAQCAFKEAKIRYPYGVHANDHHVIHDDLRGTNMLFNARDRFSAAFDYEMLVLGEPERSARPFDIPGNPDFLHECAQAYEATTGRAMDIQKVRWWAKVQPLVALCHQLQQGLPNLTLFVRAVTDLVQRFPNENWEELATAIAHTYVSKDCHRFKDLRSLETTQSKPQPVRTLTPQDALAVAVSMQVLHAARPT